MENKKEYGIYIRQGQGKPYMLKIFNDIDIAKIMLYEMISLEEERERPYFVDNDFYNNKYNISIKLRYLCIKEREVTEWEKYSEENKAIKNNVIYFNNFENSFILLFYICIDKIIQMLYINFAFLEFRKEGNFAKLQELHYSIFRTFNS